MDETPPQQEQQPQEPQPQPVPIAPLEPPGFHPDESLIDVSKKHEPSTGETRRMSGDGQGKPSHKGSR